MLDLKKGMKCDEVGDWQSFLRGLDLYIGAIDDDFGLKTEKATVDFQKKYNLSSDGVVGQNTLKKAIELGFETLSSKNKFLISLDFPEKPNFLPLVGNEARMKLFGKFDYISSATKDNPEGIKILGDWESKNIVKVNLPALSKATNGKYTSMRFHKKAESQLSKFFERLEKEKLHTKILTYSGAFYPRFIRGSRTQLSNHSWGTAFDINVPQNGLNRTPALVGQLGSVREIVPIANEYGFYWGGHFTRKDGMHFEIAKII